MYHLLAAARNSSHKWYMKGKLMVVVTAEYLQLSARGTDQIDHLQIIYR